MYDAVYVGITQAEFAKAEKLKGAPRAGKTKGSVAWYFPGVGEAHWRPAAPKGDRGYGFVKFARKEAA